MTLSSVPLIQVQMCRSHDIRVSFHIGGQFHIYSFIVSASSNSDVDRVHNKQQKKTKSSEKVRHKNVTSVNAQGYACIPRDLQVPVSTTCNIIRKPASEAKRGNLIEVSSK